MYFFLINCFAMLVTVAKGGATHTNSKIDTYRKADYQFTYSVYNDYSVDIKSHEESRNGDKVYGKYIIIDPDGFKRIVEYTVNGKEGFVARVRREPTYYRVPTYKNFVSQSLVASRASHRVSLRSPRINYSFGDKVI
ncbi:pupal cuticle protein Edg-84A-like [Hermetia illucens]|nr:pupal cuticle protein Edg-84A-like [Hermetia illucens]XP_037912266.1 pupal cuticle protein Edg-84A-like [Hermetia illucens]